MYKRFLNNHDYISIVTEEALQMLIRKNENRLAEAEEAAEMSVLEYLTENYEVEKALEVGKELRPYNAQITYPVGAHFYLDDKIYKVTRVINGRKAPAVGEYWQEYTEYIKNIEDIPFYTQRGSYLPGDIVRFSNTFFLCLNYNGVDYNNVRVPGVSAWEKADVQNWLANMEYQPWDVVIYNDKFYALLTVEDIDLTQKSSRKR